MNNRKRTLTMAERILASWKKNAPEKEFGGVKLVQLEQALRKVKEALDALLEALQGAERGRTLRDDVFESLWELFKQAKRGLVADPDHGPDDPMVLEWGYKRESDYASGLTRKSTSEETED